MPPMRKVPVGMKICGIQSADDVRWVAGSLVGATVAMMVSFVAVGCDVGNVVAAGKEVGTGTCVSEAPQAVRKIDSRIGMIFFIDK